MHPEQLKTGENVMIPIGWDVKMHCDTVGGGSLYECIFEGNWLSLEEFLDGIFFSYIQYIISGQLLKLQKSNIRAVFHSS